jgi:hypothetical protein
MDRTREAGGRGSHRTRTKIENLPLLCLPAGIGAGGEKGLAQGHTLDKGWSSARRAEVSAVASHMMQKGWGWDPRPQTHLSLSQR